LVLFALDGANALINRLNALACCLLRGRNDASFGSFFGFHLRLSRVRSLASSISSSLFSFQVGVWTGEHGADKFKVTARLHVVVGRGQTAASFGGIAGLQGIVGLIRIGA
jgi:hypothetical protein